MQNLHNLRLTAGVIYRAHTGPKMNGVIRVRNRMGFKRKPFICLFRMY